MKQKIIMSAAAVSLTAASSAIFNILRAKKAERDTPAIGNFIEVDGVRLHYIEKGSGPALILLHGNGAMLQDYELSGLMDKAAKRYRVLAFDRPGFGYSERPRSTVWTPVAQASLIFKAVRTLGITQPIIVGHSWATLVALAAALDHPGEVSGLVLLSGYYFPSARPDVLIFSPPAIPGIGDVLRFTVSPLLGRIMAPGMFDAMFSPAPVPTRFAQWPVELAMRPSQLRAAAADTAMMIAAAAMLQKRYRELDLPVMIMGGEGDKIAHFEEQSRVLHEKLPGSELVSIPHEGHMFHYAAIDIIMKAIDQVSGLRDAAAPSTGAANEIVPTALIHAL